ncbi:hypothetical protein EP867_19185 [Falsigemmobacter intermedius]|uniref:GIY-YIG domain-containing protein n=2 Tax=Falsigemmobacter intermedius TaxID=1553448 RepID=A0A451GG75_9RHOB|nr:hypothetical protein [Falsigemmobacter intermedius]RWY34542.1 hypothetical protein EP867_19185 [Falsigemmobacter intermedius]
MSNSTTPKLTQFPPEVCEAIGSYVYRLVDPRNGETFYVGKGTGNRIFQHALGALTSDEASGSLKTERIRAILAEGLEVLSIVHKYGMDDATALAVEAALIDAYPGLTNLVKGHAVDFSVTSATQILQRYTAEKVVYHHAVIEILVRFVGVGPALYDQTRFAWKLSPKSAEACDYIFAVRNGIVREVYKADRWVPANDPALGALAEESLAKRWAFIGAPAPEDIRALYVGKSVERREPGAANPIRYRSPANNTVSGVCAH